MLFSRSIAWIGKKVITYYLKPPFFQVSASLAVFFFSQRYAIKNPCGVGWGRFCAQNRIEIACVNGPLHRITISCLTLSLWCQFRMPIRIPVQSVRFVYCVSRGPISLPSQGVPGTQGLQGSKGEPVSTVTGQFNRVRSFLHG